MQEIAFVIADQPVAWGQAMLAFGLVLVLALLWLARVLSRATRQAGEDSAASAERAREIDDKIADLNRLQAEMKGGLGAVADVFGSRQADLVRLLAERLDGLQHRMGESLAGNARASHDNLSKLSERLAVIDAAQANITRLAGEVTSLRDILANKQARGAFGQARMEAIVRDSLPADAYALQASLSNRSRPDCLIRLPGDERMLVVDAKFPLEAFSALRDARDDTARASAFARVRTDVGRHVRDVSEKYLLPGETQDIALIFVPAESIYADLQEHFEDVVQTAHRRGVMIVSPMLFVMAIQLMRGIVRDQRMREEARVIQSEVGRLLDDVRRLGERVDKLDQHFRQAQDDVAGIRTSSDKIVRRADKIGALEFDDATQARALPKAAE